MLVFEFGHIFFSPGVYKVNIISAQQDNDWGQTQSRGGLQEFCTFFGAVFWLSVPSSSCMTTHEFVAMTQSLCVTDGFASISSSMSQNNVAGLIIIVWCSIACFWFLSCCRRFNMNPSGLRETERQRGLQWNMAVFACSWCSGSHFLHCAAMNVNDNNEMGWTQSKLEMQTIFGEGLVTKWRTEMSPYPYRNILINITIHQFRTQSAVFQSEMLRY